jgi:RNA polymerase sigma factor (sigma-70 family)
MSYRLYENFTDEEIIMKLISNDEKFIHYFFYSKCNPLLFKISNKLLNGVVGIEDLRHELVYVLSAHDWKTLKNFKYNSTLMGWIKVICVNICIRLRGKEDKAHLLPIYQGISERISKMDKDQISEYMKDISAPLHKMLLREKYVYEVPDEQICSLLKLRIGEYKIKLHQAEKKFIGIIENSAGLTNIMGTCPSTRINVDSNNVEDSISTKMDVKALLESMTNERYRFVIEAIVIQGRSIEEVAKELNLKKSNISNIKHRALTQLAQIAKGELNHESRYII